MCVCVSVCVCDIGRFFASKTTPYLEGLILHKTSPNGSLERGILPWNTSPPTSIKEEKFAPKFVLTQVLDDMIPIHLKV